MRTSYIASILALLTVAGCGESESNKASVNSEPIVTVPSVTKFDPSLSEMERKTAAFWEKCIEVNKLYVTDKSDVWFKEFRPATVGSTCRDAAQRMRAIDNSGVDHEVIDHVNRVIRGYEQIGAIAEVKGKESLWRDAAATMGFIINICRRLDVSAGITVDGGSVAIGIGASEQGGKATSEGQTQALGIANKLIDSEERVIRHVRKTYQIELKPW